MSEFKGGMYWRDGLTCNFDNVLTSCLILKFLGHRAHLEVLMTRGNYGQWGQRMEGENGAAKETLDRCRNVDFGIFEDVEC